MRHRETKSTNEGRGSSNRRSEFHGGAKYAISGGLTSGPRPCRSPERARRAGGRPARRWQDACSSARRLAVPACLEQEPDAPFRLVDPVLQQARGRDIAMLLAQIVRLAHVRRQPQVVLAQLGEHVQGRDVIRLVVEQALQAGGLADRAPPRPPHPPPPPPPVLRSRHYLPLPFS